MCEEDWESDGGAVEVGVGEEGERKGEKETEEIAERGECIVILDGGALTEGE